MQVSERNPVFKQMGSKVICVNYRNLASPDPSNLELAEQLQTYLPK